MITKAKERYNVHDGDVWIYLDVDYTTQTYSIMPNRGDRFIFPHTYEPVLWRTIAKLIHEANAQGEALILKYREEEQNDNLLR